MDGRFLLPCVCGKAIPVSATQAGQSVRCSCGAEVSVPALKDLRKTNRPLTSRAKGGDSLSPSWGRREALLLLGGLILVVGLLSTAWCWATRPRYLPVAAMSPIETWPLWQEIRLGVLREPSRGAKAFADATRFNRYWTAMSLVMTGAGALILACAYVVVRPTRASRTNRE